MATKIFSGTSRPPFHDPMPTSDPILGQQPHARPALELRPLHRLDLLAARNGNHFCRCQRRLRNPVKARVDGQQQRGQTVRTIRGRPADLVERVRGRQPERAAGGTDEGAEVRAAAEPLPKIAGQGSDVGAGATLHFERRGGPRRIAVVPLHQVPRRLMTTARGASSAGVPCRARSYARRPPTLSAL